MGNEMDISGLLAKRKVTRNISEYLSNQLSQHLLALAPLFNPRYVFGEYIRGGQKLGGRAGENA